MKISGVALMIVAIAVTGVAPAPRETSESAFLAENETAMTAMMDQMNIKPSGDVDRDFVELRVGRNE
jgi:hypothetical protein